MPRFRYRAIDPLGATVSGALEAPDGSAAVDSLRGRGLLPVAVKPGGAGSRLWSVLSTDITPRDALRDRDRVAFTRALATLIGAGLPLDRALEILRDLGDRRAGRAVAARLLDAVRGGSGLAAAMDGDAAAFPPLYRGMVRAGEAGAMLDATLGRLADAEEGAAARRGALRAAMIYPAFLLVSAMGSVAVLLIYVVPAFEPLLAEAGVEPPVSTRIVIAAGRTVADGWPAMLAAAGTLWVAWRVARLRPAVRLAAARTVLRLPLIGAIAAKLETARLVRMLGELLTSGVALPAALRLARAATGDAAFRAELDRVTPEVEAGRGLARPLAEGAVAAPLALQLIRVGEESGRLAPMLLKAGEILDAEAQGQIDRLLAILTPTLTLVMGGLIALIVSSILFALFSINELAL